MVRFMDKKVLLERVFGYSEFRPGQETLIDGVLSGKDVFGIMPTGGGKSICYQIPALLLPGITLVISPLISLMRDQVLALKAAGVPAAYINSTLTQAQLQTVYRNMKRGQYKIIYVAPERLEYDGFGSIAESVPISFIAVDESHCISQWGQDFRPSYLRILNFIDALPVRPTIGAFTATATEQVREDVERILQLRDPVRMVTGFDRPNLSFEVLRPKNKEDELLRLLVSRRNHSGIVYCATRKSVESVCEKLVEHGFAATRYHAGLDDEERSRNQEDFIHDRKPIMVATNAFGMGIDKSNVSYVIHYNMPKSIEAYYQEAGRAGRDGAEAECILMFNQGDINTAKFLINSSRDNEELDPAQLELVRQQDLKRLEAMVSFCKTKQCLRGFILEYFGQKHPELCGNCGNCREDLESVDITREAQMILSCVKRVQDKLGYAMGSSMIAKVLQGSKEKKLLQLELHTLSTYGLMGSKGRSEIRAMTDHLELEGYLVTDPEYQTLTLAPKASEVLFGKKAVTMLVRKEPESPSEKPSSGKLTAEETDLYESLRQLRSRLAREAGMAPYMVFSNATLEEMARKKPTTMSAFRKISGVGELKSAWYGKAFVACIKEYCP